MKFVNFRLKEERTIVLGRTEFDLHNAVLLKRQTYDVNARTFELSFSGGWLQSDPDQAIAGNLMQTEVTLTFEDVEYLRAQNEPCLEDLTPSLEHFAEVKSLVGESTQQTHYNKLFYSDEQPDWTDFWYLSFVWGVSVLIKADRVRADFRQHNQMMA